MKKLIVALLMASFVAFTSLSVGCNKGADSGSGKGGTTKTEKIEKTEKSGS